MNSPARVLIVDDHALFRDGLRAILQTVTDIELVGEASNGDEALYYAHNLQPDVILMDIKMEGMNGIEVTQQILSVLPDTHIIMLTMVEDSDSLFAAMAAGAKGYVLKGARREDVLRTIRAVIRGEVLFGDGVAGRITEFFRNLDTVQDIRPPTFPELTNRENEILMLMAQQSTNQEIARRLGITGKTVSNHISNIYNKLQVADRTQAIFKAREAGLGDEET